MEQSLHQCLVEFSIFEEGGSGEGVFIFPEDFPAFDGHFPGKPVFPAFLQLAVVRLIAEKVGEGALVPKLTGKIKFTGMVGPGRKIRVNVRLTHSNDGVQVDFKIAQEAGRVASGTLYYRIGQ